MANQLQSSDILIHWQLLYRQHGLDKVSLCPSQLGMKAVCDQLAVSAVEMLCPCVTHIKVNIIIRLFCRRVIELLLISGSFYFS